MTEKNLPISSRVWVTVPARILERLDAAIKGYYPTRSEAIRYGINLVLRDVASMRKSNGEPPWGYPSGENAGTECLPGEAEG